LTVAAAYAVPKGVHTLIAGVCEADYSGYPDCRENFVQSMEQSLSLAMGVKLEIQTPLMHLNKAQTWKLAADLGGLEVVREYSHTCYLGERSKRWDWGYGCGSCPACELRKAGYESFLKIENQGPRG
jgi:7-cyano-7-deazaguanine synthase